MRDVQIKRDVVLDAISTWTCSWSIDSQREVLKRLGKKDSVASLDIYKFFEPDHWLRVLRANGNTDLVASINSIDSRASCDGDLSDIRQSWLRDGDGRYKEALRRVA
ncbi:hypothetical protein [Microcystis sp. M112S1]|uniref:hypothetical protein n=1 Tax=Microcystis sp. M112S1 TaxID=2771103 RepID=UPI00258B7328|nr:hypothetical protein [Microcystis sp. M112S1]MCA2950264.1 hypothetical protein [Microcystis sp. M112S1]